MSCYYSYYIGYIHEDKIYPLGPYDAFGNIRPITSQSRSFASDLHKEFWLMSKKKMSPELINAFGGNDEVSSELCWDYIENLPSEESFVKSGYFLINDVEQYEKTHDTFDLFYEKLSPLVYAAKSANEAKFGVPPVQYDVEGNPFDNHSVSEYMFYAYPDYMCKEFDAFMIRHTAFSLEGYNQLPAGSKLVAICQIG